MAAPPISAEEAKRRREAIEACLRDGYAPFNTSGGRGSSVEEAARRLEMRSATLANSIRTGAVKPDWSLYQAAAERPRITVSGPEMRAVADGLALSPCETRLARVQAELRALKRDMAAIVRDNVSAAEVREVVFGLADAPINPPAWLVEEADPHLVSVEVPIVMVGDWHLGEKVDGRELHGRNSFDTHVARRRVRRLVEKTIHLARKHHSATYPGIVCCLLGDMVAGELREEDMRENELSPQQSITFAVELLSWVLNKLAAEFGRVFVPCTVGNHGRISRRPEPSSYVVRNHDWLVYAMLEREFARDPRITFDVPESGECLFRVYGRTYLQTHGDDLGVKGGDGIIGALGPIMRGKIKTSHQQAQLGRDFDCLLIGHWHQELWLPGIKVNGSLKGWDRYAHRQLRAPYARPTHSLWFVHSSGRETAHWSIELEEPEARETAPQWLEVAA